MPYMKVEEPEYWEAPEMFQAMHEDRQRRADNADSLPPHMREIIRKFRSTQFLMGPPDSSDTPAANVISMPPGYALPHHAHDCDVFMLVLRGSLYAPGKVLGPGDGMTASAGEFYGPEVAGPDGCLRVEFFGKLQGLTDTLYMRNNGEVFNYSAFEKGDTPPYRELAGMEPLKDLLSAVRTQMPPV